MNELETTAEDMRAGRKIKITIEDEVTGESLSWHGIVKPEDTSFDEIASYFMRVTARGVDIRVAKEKTDKVLAQTQRKYAMLCMTKSITDHRDPAAKSIRKRLYKEYMTRTKEEGIEGAGSYTDKSNFEDALIRTPLPDFFVSFSPPDYRPFLKKGEG